LRYDFLCVIVINNDNNNSLLSCGSFHFIHYTHIHRLRAHYNIIIRACALAIRRQRAITRPPTRCRAPSIVFVIIMTTILLYFTDDKTICSYVLSWFDVGCAIYSYIYYINYLRENLFLSTCSGRSGLE